jgi:hypothetical protein
MKHDTMLSRRLKTEELLPEEMPLDMASEIVLE